MLEILERIVEGNGKLSDLDELEELADMIESTALCGLGRVHQSRLSVRSCVQRGIRRAYLKETLQSRRLFKSPYI